MEKVIRLPHNDKAIYIEKRAFPIKISYSIFHVNEDPTDIVLIVTEVGLEDSAKPEVLERFKKQLLRNLVATHGNNADGSLEVFIKTPEGFNELSLVNGKIKETNISSKRLKKIKSYLELEENDL